MLQNKKNNVVFIHANQQEKAARAMQLMDERKAINAIEDQQEKIARLGIWRVEAEKYWAMF